MNNILVTGGNGQLGNELRILSSKKSGNCSYEFIDIDDLDLTNKDEVIDFFKHKKYNWIINCAAYTAVDKAETEKEIAEKINCNAIYNIIEAAEFNKSKIIHISTDFVFNGAKSEPYNEEDTTEPINYYGITKLKGEQVLKNNYDKYFIIRTSWLYSVYGNNFVKTILKLAKERDSINVVYDQIGTPTNAADLAAVIIDIIGKDIDLFGIYHYSNEGAASWYDFAVAICRLAELNCNIQPILSKDFPTLAKRPSYSVLDKIKIKTITNKKIPNWYDSLNIVSNNLKCRIENIN